MKNEATSISQPANDKYEQRDKALKAGLIGRLSCFQSFWLVDQLARRGNPSSYSWFTANTVSEWTSACETVAFLRDYANLWMPSDFDAFRNELHEISKSLKTVSGEAVANKEN